MLKKTTFIVLLLNTLLIGCQSEKEPDNPTPKPKIKESNHFVEEKLENITEALELPIEQLQKFDRGTSVSQLNDFLISLGYDINTSDTFNFFTTWAITDIQLQLTPHNVTGIYDTQTKETLDALNNNELTITVEKGIKKPSDPLELTKVTTNPYDILVLINKQYALPSDYVPIDLTVPNIRFPVTEDDPKKQLRKIAATAIEALFNDSDDAGLELFALSGYRSYDRQKTIFENNVARHGETHANTYSARAGESEHQTGLVMDVTNQEIKFDLVTDFGNTKEGLWLKENAHNYGFIIRYPKDKVQITKYQYEPWHLRYVGIKLATELYKNNWTLEEYYKKQL